MANASPTIAHNLTPQQLPFSSGHTAAQQQVAGHVHRLHGVVAAAPIGVVVGGGELPGPGHIRLPQAAGQGEPKTLAGDDRIEIGGLAEW